MPICKDGCFSGGRFGNNARRQFSVPGRNLPLLSVPGKDNAGALYWDTAATARSAANRNGGAGPTLNAGYRGPAVAAPGASSAAPFVGVTTPTAAPDMVPSKNPVAMIGDNVPVFGRGECVLPGAPEMAIAPGLLPDGAKKFIGLSVAGLLIASVLADVNGGRV